MVTVEHETKHKPFCAQALYECLGLKLLQLPVQKHGSSLSIQVINDRLLCQSQREAL